MNYTLSCNSACKLGSYSIHINDTILNKPENILKYLHAYGPIFAIVTDDIVAEILGKKLNSLLLANGYKTHLFSFPHGESSKTRQMKEAIENQMFELNLGKDTCIIALGGGVATDLAGYIAATYCRGLPLVMIPTSLLAMVDASIGGKNGVNVPFGKNLIGSFYPPNEVIIDISILSTLPQKELSNGIVEMIKHGLILDYSHFDYLEKNSKKFMHLDLSIVIEAVYQSCCIKQVIVQEDEKEKGKRHLLNFGHTIGHALEYLTQFTLPHGEAVAIGIMTESYLSILLGYLSEDTLKAIERIFRAYQIPLKLSHTFTDDQLLNAMVLDKKSIQGLPRFVILQDVGKSVSFDGTYCCSIEKNLLLKALQWMNKCFA